MTELKNFNPSFDALRRQYGGTAADVYGRIYRYAQMPAGYCFAPQQRIADDLGYCRTTVNTKIKLLIKEGYLEKLNSKKGRALCLQPTGKAEIENGCAKPEPVDNNQHQYSQTDVTDLNQGVQNIDTKKEFNRQVKEKKKSKRIKKRS